MPSDENTHKLKTKTTITSSRLEWTVLTAIFVLRD